MGGLSAVETCWPYVGCALDTSPKRRRRPDLRVRTKLTLLPVAQAGDTVRARRTRRDLVAMTVTNPALPLSAADIERTCLPLEQATMLPGAAYTDYEVFQWERANFFRQGWICAGHIEQVASRGQFLTLEAGGENVLVVGDDDGLPRAFLNTCRHRGARLVIQPAGHPAAHPVPVPRLDLRLRRQPQERAVHRRPAGLRPEVLLAARGPPRGRRGPRAARPLGRGAAAAGAHRRPRADARVRTATPSSSAAPGSSTTSPPTGRRSARTTASACTARACTRSSTASRTT